MTTEVRCPELPDIKLVSGVQWQDAHEAQQAIHNSQRFRMPLPTSTWNSLRMAAIQNFDKEVCGFIDSRWNLHFVHNVSADPVRNFEMDQNEVRRIVEWLSVANEHIVGVFHTHPGGLSTPSANDIVGWPNRDLAWRYFIATSADVYEYEYRNQPAHKLA